jgi:hypothetical protein
MHYRYWDEEFGVDELRIEERNGEALCKGGQGPEDELRIEERNGEARCKGGQGPEGAVETYMIVTNLSGRSLCPWVQGVGLKSFDCWDRGFESR